MCASGYSSRTARSVGVAMTASPTQLGCTIRIRSGDCNIDLGIYRNRRAVPTALPGLRSGHRNSLVQTNPNPEGGFMRRNIALKAVVVLAALLMSTIVRAADTFKIDPIHATVIYRIKHIGVG